MRLRSFEEQIEERQKQAQDGCDANHLSYELAGLRSQEACRDEPNKCTGGVHGDRT